MHKSRPRPRVTRTLSNKHGPDWTLILCVLAGSFLLLGSVAVLQYRLTTVGLHPSQLLVEPEQRTGNSGDDWESLWTSEERDEKFEEEEGKADNDESESFNDVQRVTNFEDESKRSKPSRLESKDTEEKNSNPFPDGHGLKGFENVMELEDDDVDEFEDIGGWLNEVDDRRERKHSLGAKSTNVSQLEEEIDSLNGESIASGAGDASKVSRRRAELASSNAVDVDTTVDPTVTKNRISENPPGTTPFESKSSRKHSYLKGGLQLNEFSSEGVRPRISDRAKDGADVGVMREESKEESSKGVFSSDDEPIDEETRNRVERMSNIEDVLMINRGASSSRKKNGGKSSGEFSKKDKSDGKSADPLVNNPLLQDPDSSSQSGLTKDDRVLLKLTTWKNIARSLFPGQKENLRTDSHKNSDEKPSTALKEEQGNQRDVLLSTTESLSMDNAKSGKVGIIEPFARLGLDHTENVSNANPGGENQIGESNEGIAAATARTVEMPVDTKKQGRRVHDLNPKNDPRKWGNFPGLHPRLSYSGFVNEFLFDEKCSMRVFMVWMSAPWSFTVRHQRVLESLLIIHPKACVVVFSETMELTFFKSFVDEGYRVAVVMPNLAELLADTPADVFAIIWMQWRKVKLFYIHYSELLRLAALYKYGGIYLDLDMIVLKPLTGLNNTIGAEVLENGEQRPNGAVMVFERFSPFLNSCMKEFTATYDDTVMDWNGAALLDRVIKAWPNEDVNSAVGGEPSVEPPTIFFPLSLSNISRYFVAPEGDQSIAEEEDLMTHILLQSTTVHIWNGLTSSLVPEPGSLVEKFINRKCLRCTDIL